MTVLLFSNSVRAKSFVVIDVLFNIALRGCQNSDCTESAFKKVFAVQFKIRPDTVWREPTRLPSNLSRAISFIFRSRFVQWVLVCLHGLARIQNAHLIKGSSLGGIVHYAGNKLKGSILPSSATY